ncbi:8978_t:CDS:10 [Diversispora eburnea]|uniref:8978_t:CDS:1 n=1 Tax=Diversispora eburnea TaxID=1213867 RepID=A0A9N9CP59_9GLOM|nr:8978_t:CDS:10 [Diversispora eburnea]
MSSNLSYFDELPERWSIHGYYEFRKRQSDFSGIFHKENGWLKINLETIANNKEAYFNDEQVARALMMLRALKNQMSDPEVAIFWKEIDFQRTLKSQIEIARVDGVLRMFEGTNTSQQHVINIQHQDSLAYINLVRETEDNIQESRKSDKKDILDGTDNEEGELTKYAHSQEENKENVPTCKKTKKRPNTKNQRPRNDNEKFSSEFPSPPDVGLEDNDEIKVDFTSTERELLRESTNEWVFGTINVSRKFRQYQIEVLKKAKTNGLKWSDFYEMLALFSIIVLISPCPYPSYIFTIQKWQMITRENPYTIADPVLPMEVLPFLRNASADSLEGKTAFFCPYVILKLAKCSSVPDISATKTSEDEHCFKLLHPIIRPLFFTSSYKEYNIRLNRATSDKLKVQLRGRKSINQLLRMKGDPAETVLLINQGDLVESYVMDLKYDGLYRSWPFLTTRLVKDKTTIPLLESNIRHFMALEERINKIAEDYNRRTCQSGTTTPPLQIQYMRDLPGSPQMQEILNSKCG